MAPRTPEFSVGLTGGIGSGKSTVASLFAARGVTLIDTDQIAHDLTAPGGVALAAIEATFGSEFLQADGAMDRAKMRAHVFSQPDAKQRLEAILHPLIRQAVETASQQPSHLYRIFIVPLLVESGAWRDRVSRILVVDCPEALQLRRVMQRSGILEEQAKAIMATQASRAQRLAAADDVIQNAMDAQALVPQVDRLHALYLSLAASH